MILKFAEESHITLLPISGAWLCLYQKEIYNLIDSDLFPEFIVDEEDFKKLTAMFILNDKFILRSETDNLNRCAIKIGKEILFFNIYKKVKKQKTCFSDLPVELIWNRSKVNDFVRILQFEDGLLTLFWRSYHLLYKRDNRYKSVNYSELIKKANSKVLLKYSTDYNIQRYTKLLIRKPIMNSIEFTKSELIKKMYIKMLYSDYKFRYGFNSIINIGIKWFGQKITKFKTGIIKTFAKSYIIRKELGNKENENRLLNRLGAQWGIGSKIDGKYLISTSSGLWLLAGEKITMILPGGCFGITGGPDKWYVCQYTGDYSRILEFTLFEQDGKILLLEKKNYLTGLSPNIHQIDLYDNNLYIVNAEENSILISSERGMKRVYYPNKKIKKGSKRNNHFNSVFINKDDVFLMAHNGTTKSLKNSEIYILNRKSLKVDSIKEIKAQKAHNIFFLNEKLGFCNSPSGELIVNDKVLFKDENYFLRGVAISEDSIVVGGSEFATRENRDKTSSMIFELEHNGSVKNKVFLNNIGQIYDIRYVGNDLGMSKYAD